MRTLRTDVLVVGAGPTGLAAAAFLSRAGIKTISLSRHSGTAPQPRASFTNQRTMEVFRDLGIESDVLAVASRGPTMGHNVMATSLSGQEILRYQTYGTGDRLLDFTSASPCEYVNAPQHVLEPVMLKAARQQGAEVLFSHEMLTIEQTDDEVIAQVHDRQAGEEYEIRAKYAIGADGGRSRVAEQLGVPFEGEAAFIHMFNAWLKVDLTKYVAHRPAGLYMIIQPGKRSWVGSGTFSTVRHWDEFIFSKEYDPSAGEPDLSDEALIDQARALIGDPDIPISVKGLYKWQVNNLIAKEYRRGRVLIAGDAAHRHSPAGGLGSNTCIQDAYNLAWKLAFVLKGKAGEGLLESYDEERQPIGRQVVNRALSNLNNKSAVTDALGLRPGQSTDEGWAAIRSLFSDEEGAAERRQALVKVRSLQHYRSNAHGVFMGQRYTSSAIADDGTPFPTPTRDPEIYYHPTTHPGARLPHVWIERDRKRLSTLDIAGHDRFCLIVGIGGAPWIEAAATLATELGIELPAFAIGYRCDYDDPVGDWERIREIDDRGALLIRPDLHVAWRSIGRPTDPRRALEHGLRTALARSVN